MATKLENLNLDIAHYDHLEPYVIKLLQKRFGKFKQCKKTKNAYLLTGFIQVSTVFEAVMADLTSSIVSSLDSNDLSNGADCKTITARTSSSGTRYSAPVSDIYHKSGTLYVICYERKNDKFYYFAIPRHAYSEIPKTSNIEIPFELDGTPRRTPRGPRKYANWWDYECTSLEDMATFCGKTGVRISTTPETIVSTPFFAGVGRFVYRIVIKILALSAVIC